MILLFIYMCCTNFLIHDPISSYPPNNINQIFELIELLLTLYSYLKQNNTLHILTVAKMKQARKLVSLLFYQTLLPILSCVGQCSNYLCTTLFSSFGRYLTIQYQRVILVLKSPYYCLEHVCISTTRIMLKLIQKKKWKSLLY